MPAQVGGVRQRCSAGGSNRAELCNEAAPSLHIVSTGAQRSSGGLNDPGGGRQVGGRSLTGQIEIAVGIHGDRGAIGTAAAIFASIIRAAEESGIEQLRAGGIERRGEGVLG